MKNPDAQKVVAYGADGKLRRIAAERLEIDLGRGRRVVIDFSAQALGDLHIEAQTDAGMPCIGVMPGACNLLTLHVDAYHDAAPAELGELPAPAHEPELVLTVQKAFGEADKALAPRKHRIRRWARAALRRDAEVTVRLVGEEEGRALNRDYRGKDHATNVLTFVYGGGGPDEAAADAPQMGDLVLCVPVVAREAVEQGKDLEAHYAHLVVHGMLHLQGYDHKADADAAVMEALETEILAALGYPDPYV